LFVDAYYNRRRCRQIWFRDRSVSIPPYLRPIEEESDSEDQLEPLLVDCCDDSTNCRVVTSSAGDRDVIIPRPVSELLQRDVISNGKCAFDRAFDKDRTSTHDVTESPSRDCRQPINECVTMKTGLRDEGGTYTTGDNCVTHNDVIGESLSRDYRRQTNGEDTCRTGGNNLPSDDVTTGSQSSQRCQLCYIVMASLIAFIACLISVSPSCVIFIVIVTSLIAHHIILS